MVRSAYTIGRGAEYLIMRKLESRGYRFLIRSAGSHGAIDILASNGLGEVLAVSVRKRGRLTVAEREALLEWARAFKARPIIASKCRGRWALSYLDEHKVAIARRPNKKLWDPPGHPAR